MSSSINTILNSSGTALIIFTVSAALAGIWTKSAATRIAAGLAVLVATLFLSISTRSLFAWTVSGVERPSFPGFMLLAVLAVATITRRPIAASAEFRFATLVLAVAGLFLYPAANGFLNRDPYVAGYSGYLLCAAVAVVIAYALFRGYLLTAFALNVAIVAFLLNVGASRNLWDYVMDPVAWLIGCGTWIALAAGFAIRAIAPAKIQPVSQPSSGIGETPISH
ncbi:MAG: hypothetical protein QM780_09760 [Hyphomicrobium sp.]|uniref:hypothetical protein n=1 Tax=Hyphomicrobium sp. TaxID=82 RepID=UPI0039E70CD9